MLSDLLLQEIAVGQGEPLARAALRIPSSRNGRPVTLSCLLRWVLSGVQGPDGHRVKLEAARLAGRWITTPGAIRRFVEAQTPNPPADGITSPRPLEKRKRSSELAAKELERNGI